MSLSTEKLSLAANSVLVRLFVSVTGITRRTDDEKERVDGKALEVERTTTTRVNDPAEAGAAKKLANQLRAIADKHTASVLGMSLTTAEKIPALRAEIDPVREAIRAHNASARFHRIDSALILAPIGLNADRETLTEVLRQVTDELKVAKAFFDAATLSPDAVLKSWLVPLDNWRDRTKNLGNLFPNITGQCIAEALESVDDLRSKVAVAARSAEKVGHSPESALRNALQTVLSVGGALGLLDTAIGLTTVTDSEAKEQNDAAREGLEGVH